MILQKSSNQPYLCFLFGVLYPETIRIHKIPNEENFISKNHEFNEPSTHEPWFWSKSIRMSIRDKRVTSQIFTRRAVLFLVSSESNVNNSIMFCNFKSHYFCSSVLHHIDHNNHIQTSSKIYVATGKVRWQRMSKVWKPCL